MALSLAKLRARRASVSFDYDTGDGKEQVNLVYNPEMMTPNLAERITAEVNGSDVAAISRLVAALVVSWDVVEGNKSYPLTVEALGELGVPFLSAVLTEMKEHMAPNPKQTPTS